MNKLKYIRQESGMSQRELAERADVSASYICNAENRGLKLYPGQAQRVADVLGWDDDPMKLFDEVEVVEAK